MAELPGEFTGDCWAERCLEAERDGGTAQDGPLAPEQTCSPIEDSDQDTEGTYAANWPQGQSEKRED